MATQHQLPIKPKLNPRYRLATELDSFRGFFGAIYRSFVIIKNPVVWNIDFFLTRLSSNLHNLLIRIQHIGSIYVLLIRPTVSITGSAVGYSSIGAGFKPRPDYVRRVFHLWLRLITFWGRSAHLAYRVQKSSLKNSNIYIFLPMGRLSDAARTTWP